MTNPIRTHPAFRPFTSQLARLAPEEPGSFPNALAEAESAVARARTLAALNGLDDASAERLVLAVALRRVEPARAASLANPVLDALARVAAADHGPCGFRARPGVLRSLHSLADGLSRLTLSPEPEPRLGIDVGRVLISAGGDDGADTSFLTGSDEDALRTPPMSDAFEVTARLVRAFEGRAWIVSKAGDRVQARTRRWFEHWRFFETTGLPQAHVRFCARRPEKRLHAAELGLTWFIDDRVDVLKHLVGAVPYLVHFGGTPGETPPFAHPARDWRAVERLVLDEAGAVRRYDSVGKSRNAGGTAPVSQTPLVDR